MGDSYSGIIIPILIQEISDGNEAGREPRMNLKGYVIGNSLTNCQVDLNARIPFAHLKALISDELYEVNLPLCIEEIVTGHILEPTCQLLSPKPRPRVSKWDPDTSIDDSADLLQSITHLPKPRRWCRFKRLFMFGSQGSINEWVRCNESLVYTYDVSSSLNYHRNLIKKGYEVLIYR
ncbi:serine carboxypeptidase-like 17 [Quercus lobata]|uniref:serine carboxypeptidase-like 17 n=1 Tax=Quercus lobata TaxID=97700 RepID=UPI0012458E70|nr:serine carboxypeptidase-like 17 [Quercus lobata]